MRCITAIVAITGLTAAASAQPLVVNITPDKQWYAVGETATFTVSSVWDVPGAAAFNPLVAFTTFVTVNGAVTSYDGWTLDAPADITGATGFDTGVMDPALGSWGFVTDTEGLPPGFVNGGEFVLGTFSLTILDVGPIHVSLAQSNVGVATLLTAALPTFWFELPDNPTSVDFQAVVNGVTVGIPTPGAAALLGLGGVAALRRRR